MEAAELEVSAVQGAMLVPVEPTAEAANKMMGDMAPLAAEEVMAGEAATAAAEPVALPSELRAGEALLRNLRP